MVLRVLQLEPEDRDYILEFMDHTQDRKEGTGGGDNQWPVSSSCQS